MSLPELSKLVAMSLDYNHLSFEVSKSWNFNVWNGQRGDGNGPYYFCLRYQDDVALYGNQQSSNEVDEWLSMKELQLELDQSIRKGEQDDRRARL